MRLCLLAGEFKKTDRRSGEVNILGNKYWSEDLAAMAGERVIVRFDPDNLHSEIFIYRQDGSYVGPAPIWQAEGFADQAAARKHSRIKKKFMKAQKDMADQEIALDIADVAKLLPELQELDTPAIPETKVVRPVFRTQGNAAVKPEFDYEAFGKNVSNLTTPKEI